MLTDTTRDISHASDASHCFAVMIANPNSGSGVFVHHTHRLHETASFLRSQGWRVELCYTQRAGDAEQLARTAVEQKADIVIAVGGDGTINEIIQALAGSETALGVIPTGTVNVWAREMGIPFYDAGARDVLLHGQTRCIDLGCVNGRYFLMMVGIGLDGTITQAVEKKPLKRLGIFGYFLAATWLGPGYQSFPVTFHKDRRTVNMRALQVFVGNTQLYAGAFKFTWQAKCDDGLLDLVIVRRRGPLGRLIVLWDFVVGRKHRSHWVRYETFTSLTIETPQPVAIQVDGEAAGYTPAAFSILPASLKVIVPQKVPADVFSQDENS
ncbi:MAG TPA: diacylglycerol kinase family protein [Ktedonobacteraceae bacterium]|jgi:diacylglycerol kinase (ATP)|nr:diacylglycerol kinase family protein [Ktedonobacteraceae bacterium]